MPFDQFGQPTVFVSTPDATDDPKNGTYRSVVTMPSDPCVVWSRQGWFFGNAAVSSTTSGTTFVHVHPDTPFRDIQLVIAHAIPSGTSGGPNGGYQYDTMPPTSLSVQATVSTPLYVCKVTAATQTTVTLTDLYGKSPAFDVNSLTNAYLVTPWSDNPLVNHKRKQIASNTGNVVTIVNAYSTGTVNGVADSPLAPQVGDEVVIYTAGKDMTLGATAIGVVGGRMVIKTDPLPGVYPTIRLPLSRFAYGAMVGVFGEAGVGGSFGKGAAYDPLEGSFGGQDRRKTPILQLGTSLGGDGPMVAAVLGRPTQATRGSLGILGDSIAFGVNGTQDGGRKGALQLAGDRMGFGVMNMAVPSETAQAAATNVGTRLAAMDAAGVTECWLAYGVNDGLRTAAQIIADLQSIRALRPNWTWRVATVTPFSTTSDGKTPNTWSTTERVTLNAAIRAGLPGFAACLDVAACYEGPGSTWQDRMTTDGVHPADWAIRQAATILSGAG